jgi:4'-phosphopantetheinyl transferase
MRIYVCGIEEFLGLDGFDLVTEVRRRRINSYKQVADKARCLVAGLLLRRFCGVTDDSMLSSGKNGKPYLNGSDIFFNISHSGDYVVLAVAGREVGVDIEKIAPYSEAVSARCFTPEEREWVSRAGDNAFFRVWTAKESAAKAIGLGLSLSPSSFSVLPADSPAHIIMNRTWFFDWISYDGHMICRAIEDENEETELCFLSRP